MRLTVSVGELSTKDIVSVCRAEDGSMHIKVSNRLYKATYQRTSAGYFLLSSTYPKDKYAAMYAALNSIDTEIERRCIELSEAEFRIDYLPVLIDEGQTIKVGQSNSLTIYITVEDFEHRALFNYLGDKVQFVRSTYPPEYGATISAIIKRNIAKIREVMVENGMIEGDNTSGRRQGKLYKEGFSSTMTETGKEERKKVDDTVQAIFLELESKEYSNLEIQSMLMESVFEVALQHRKKYQPTN